MSNEINQIIEFLPSVSVNVTDFCSLNCKLCLAYIPYYRDHKHMTIEEFNTIINRIFQLTKRIEKFSLTGGEPLLNPNINEMIKKLKNYCECIDEIILITNGTIAFKDDILDAISGIPNIKVIINKYGELSKYADYNYNIIKEMGVDSIIYTESNRYSWIDCRDNSLKHLKSDEISEQAKTCVFHNGKKFVVSRGKLYSCGRSAYRIENNIIPANSNEYIDLINQDNKSDILKLYNFLNRKSSMSCAYCDGLTKNSPKYPAAEQI